METNNLSTFNPDFALTSMTWSIFNDSALFVASLNVTSRVLSKSNLFPTNTICIFSIFVQYSFTFPYQKLILFNDFLLEMSYTKHTQCVFLIYVGINDLNLSCPAVSQSCNLILVSSSLKAVFVKKSTPMVACNQNY